MARPFHSSHFKVQIPGGVTHTTDMLVYQVYVVLSVSNPIAPGSTKNIHVHAPKTIRVCPVRVFEETSKAIHRCFARRGGLAVSLGFIAKQAYCISQREGKGLCFRKTCPLTACTESCFARNFAFRTLGL